MKKPIMVITGTLIASSVSSQAAVLLAGWDTWVAASGTTYSSAASATSSHATGSVAGTRTNAAGSFGTGATGYGFGASTDGTWGTIAATTGIPAANTAAAATTDSVGLVNTAQGYFDFTITAAAGTTIDFTGFNFDAYRRFGNSANAWALSVVSGDITNGAITSGTLTQAATGTSTLDATANSDFDVSLTGLADRQLTAGQSAVFRLAFTGGNSGGNGGNNVMLDNVAVFGDVIPEPSTLGLAMIGALGLLARRRR